MAVVAVATTKSNYCPNHFWCWCWWWIDDLPSFLILFSLTPFNLVCSLVFRMLEDEEENVNQLEILVARFYRPFKMAASSKKWVVFFFGN